MSSSSKIFIRYRALGYVSNHIPVVTRYIKRRREYLFVTCVGKSFHTYNSTHLAILTASDLHPDEITCIAGDSYLIFTAAGTKIFAWRRGTELKHEYIGHEYPIKLMLPFGPHLISIDESSCLKLWNIKTTEMQLQLDFSNVHFEITSVMHPVTYLNKILLGSEQGSLQLWNLNTSKLIYTFKGWGSGVNVIEQSPAVDVVGIGLKNGRIFLHNLKFDETLMDFEQEWGIVTSLTFKVDSPFMISGTMYGHMVLWNLEERKMFSQIQKAHDDIITGMQCLQNLPLMITSSPDNSLKLWAFDMPDGGPRLLIKREGHSLPPTFIRFHGANGHNLLSAGGDSHLRIFNTVTERFNKSLGKASYNRKLSKKKGRLEKDVFKMPPIIKFTADTTREKEWDNIGAIHIGTTEVTTWSYDKLRMGDYKLIHNRFKSKATNLGVSKYKAYPISVHLTHCGNFILVGYTSGHCDRYNIQSGIHRATYGNDKAHEGPVRGVTTDLLNLVVLTGGGDKLIKWWNFKAESSVKEIFTIILEDSVSFFTTHTESSLTAVALENFSIVIVDIEGRNVIRKFDGHSGKINDMAFSPDSRWLISSGMDCCIFTWDIPSGFLIDHFKVDAACTSLSFSPTGELLATTHVEYLGIFLWANRTLYEHVTLKPIKNVTNIPTLALPSVAEETVASEIAEESDEEIESLEQIESLLTLSDLSASRWQNLLNIDVIRKRNKPKEKLQVPKVAPFFLPTIPSMDITFDLSAAENFNNTTKVISITKPEALTAFASTLKNAKSNYDFYKVFEKLKCMGPSTIDFEINSLAFDVQYSSKLQSQFLKMIEIVSERHVDFELIQAYLGLFLKVHGAAIIESDQLLSQLEGMKQAQIKGWKTVENHLHYNLSLIRALKSELS